MDLREPVSILLVEDDEVDVMAVERLLARCQTPHSLHHAVNGLEALEQLSCGNLSEPVLVLLDLNMPRMGGLEFLHALRSDDDLRDTVVFVLTTSSRQEDMEESQRLQVAGYFLKDEFSTSPDQLQQALAMFRSMTSFRAPPA
jgi:CheY-like chemotaxis protein